MIWKFFTSADFAQKSVDCLISCEIFRNLIDDVIDLLKEPFLNYYESHIDRHKYKFIDSICSETGHRESSLFRVKISL